MGAARAEEEGWGGSEAGGGEGKRGGRLRDRGSPPARLSPSECPGAAQSQRAQQDTFGHTLRCSRVRTRRVQVAVADLRKRRQRRNVSKVRRRHPAATRCRLLLGGHALPQAGVGRCRGREGRRGGARGTINFEIGGSAGAEGVPGAVAAAARLPTFRPAAQPCS